MNILSLGMIDRPRGDSFLSDIGDGFIFLECAFLPIRFVKRKIGGKV
jgi:hypothetical protein